MELRAGRDVEVREGRVDLVCEERYTETYTIMVHDPRTVRAQYRMPRGASLAPPPRIPKEVTKEHRETYVHSSAVFLQDTRLRSGATSRYNVRLEIQPEPPPHADRASLKWKLVTAVDVALARDITKKQTIKVTLR
ncbi:MAG: hypothetical protein IH860_02650 [Chloroflexi bacterium]|nr:hypothetical protein [Chloroflexota bacterium]